MKIQTELTDKKLKAALAFFAIATFISFVIAFEFKMLAFYPITVVLFLGLIATRLWVWWNHG